MEPIAVRPAEAAKALGLSRTALYSILSTGELESIKVGTSRLIPVSALRKFVDEQRAAALTPAVATGDPDHEPDVTQR